MDVIEPAPLTGPAAPRLDPESPLVTAAVALLGRHTVDEAERTCRSCGESYPCDSGVHAVFVCRAAGLDLASVGLPAEASRWELAG
jgi:hypothetical protein